MGRDERFEINISSEPDFSGIRPDIQRSDRQRNLVPHGRGSELCHDTSLCCGFSYRVSCLDMGHG